MLPIHAKTAFTDQHMRTITVRKKVTSPCHKLEWKFTAKATTFSLPLVYTNVRAGDRL